MNEIDTAGLRAAAEAATPGPWGMDEIFDVWSQEADGQPNLIASTGHMVEWNGAYIAAVSPDVMLALLDRLVAAESAVDRVREWIDSDEEPEVSLYSALTGSSDPWPLGSADDLQGPQIDAQERS